MMLEQLQYDKRFEPAIGVHSFRKYMYNRIWRSYQDSVPAVLKALRQSRADAERELLSFETLTLAPIERLRAAGMTFEVEA